MKRESESERNQRLTREESEKWRRSAAKERMRQDAIAYANRRKTDEERKHYAEFEDSIIGKNATLNEREALRGALTASLIDKMAKDEILIKIAQKRSDDFVERWTGKKHSKKQSTER